MLRFLVALFVVIATIQCASACVPVATGCPHHKHTPARCAQELVPATVAQASTILVSFAAEPIGQLFTRFEARSFDAPPVLSPSPPLISRSLVLRI
jgi:hypothetical protein